MFVLAIVMMFFAFMFTVIRMRHKQEMAKLDRIAQGNADRSLTTGELEDLIREVVTEMLDPLEKRVDLVTQQLGAGNVTLPDVDEDSAGDSAREKTLGRSRT